MTQMTIDAVDSEVTHAALLECVYICSILYTWIRKIIQKINNIL
jgi:hypothetical protein